MPCVLCKQACYIASQTSGMLTPLVNGPMLLLFAMTGQLSLLKDSSSGRIRIKLQRTRSPSCEVVVCSRCHEIAPGIWERQTKKSEESSGFYSLLLMVRMGHVVLYGIYCFLSCKRVLNAPDRSYLRKRMRTLADHVSSQTFQQTMRVRLTNRACVVGSDDLDYNPVGAANAKESAKEYLKSVQAVHRLLPH